MLHMDPGSAPRQTPDLRRAEAISMSFLLAGSAGAATTGRPGEIEALLTPYKLAVSVFINEFCLALSAGDDDEDLDDEKERANGGIAGGHGSKEDEDGGGSLGSDSGHHDDAHHQQAGPMAPAHKKAAFMLILKLIQSPVDLTLGQMVSYVLGADLSPGLASAWVTHLETALEEQVAGVMELTADLKKLIYTDFQMPLINKHSVVGYYLRRIFLYFDQLSFSDVSHVYYNFEAYMKAGRTALDKVKAKVASHKDNSDGDQDMTACSEEVTEATEAAAGHNAEDKEPVVHSRHQAEMYIARQVELIQNAELAAGSPAEVSAMVTRILEGNPDMSEAHFLAYINALRTNDYSAAVDSLIRSCKVEGLDQEETSSGLRYAALNLVALHARFSHVESARAALREAISMAQEDGDKICLQHALGWVYRLHSGDSCNPSIKKNLIRKSVANAESLGLTYLKGLSLQSNATLIALLGDSPASVWDELTRCDMIACQSSDADLISAGFTQKSAFWTLYGRGWMSACTSQLLLGLNTSDSRRQRGGRNLATEHVAIALCNVARSLYQRGQGKPADKVVKLARLVFPNPSAVYGSLVRCSELEIQFRRALHKTDWVEAERCLSFLKPLDSLEAAMLRVQLHLWKGDADEVQSLLRRVEKATGGGGAGGLTPNYRARLLVAETEWHCMLSSYTTAIKPALQALELCQTYHLDFLEAVVRLHIAHIQLHIGMHMDSIEAVKAILPILLSQGDQFEISRAYLLLAKCVVASVNKPGDGQPRLSAEERKVRIESAVGHLRAAADGFRQLGSHHRVKDVLYIMCRLYHSMDMFAERNQAAAEFKRTDEQHPTNITSRLTQML